MQLCMICQLTWYDIGMLRCNLLCGWYAEVSYIMVWYIIVFYGIAMYGYDIVSDGTLWYVMDTDGI